jgi:hypothetical protein
MSGYTVRFADPEPDDQSLDITGGWEEDNGATFRVNQAGTHFEGWFVDYTTKQLTQVGGDFANGQAQVFDSPSGSRALGTLTARSSTQLTFASNMRSAAFNLRRIDEGRKSKPFQTGKPALQVT